MSSPRRVKYTVLCRKCPSHDRLHIVAVREPTDLCTKHRRSEKHRRWYHTTAKRNPEQMERIRQWRRAGDRRYKAAHRELLRAKSRERMRELRRLDPAAAAERDRDRRERWRIPYRKRPLAECYLKIALI